MMFPQDLLRFLYRIFFKPLSLHTWIDGIDPTIHNVATLLTYPHHQSVRAFRNLALFYIFIAPWLLGLGAGLVLLQLGMDVNWLKLAFYLFIAIALSLTLSVNFSIAFLLPFSVVVAFWSSNSFTPALGIFFSLTLGLAYGLTANSARWGMIAGLVYSLVLGIVLDPLQGTFIGVVFLIGYFRIIFYWVEAPLSWILATRAAKEDALRLWRFNPVVWDELIWFPLPRLDRHLLEIKRQNESAAQAAILQVQESFRQRWAAKRFLNES